MTDANVINLALYREFRRLCAAHEKSVIEPSVFMRMSDGRIVMTFIGWDAGQPALLGIDDLSKDDFFFIDQATEQLERLGTMAELMDNNQPLSDQCVLEMMKIGAADPLSFVRMLDAQLNGAGGYQI
jgi:hypothetical protein